MKVLGFMTIHYGKEYLKQSLQSVVNHVDEMVVSYSRLPSHGHATTKVCPDSEEEIFLICKEVLGDKLIWRRAERFINEASHRNIRYEHSEGKDLILTIDADEVFESSELDNALKYAFDNKERYFGIKGYVNLWRSFDYACYDGFRPIRIENNYNANQRQNLECPLTIYHFSTCQSEEVMRYKYKIFGHASEMRNDWLNKYYYDWTPENNIQDIHPVALGLWNAVEFDKNKMPEILKQHPNYGKRLI